MQYKLGIEEGQWYKPSESVTLFDNKGKTIGKADICIPYVEKLHTCYNDLLHPVNTLNRNTMYTMGGYISLNENVSPDKIGENKKFIVSKKQLYLIGISVRQPYVGKGIGRIFLQMLFEHYNCDKMLLDCIIKHPVWEKYAEKLNLNKGGNGCYILHKDSYYVKGV
jgi:hypothetical protein